MDGCRRIEWLLKDLSCRFQYGKFLNGKCMLTLECSCQTSLAGLNAMRWDQQGEWFLAFSDLLRSSGVWGLVLGEYCRLAVLKRNLRCGPDDPVRMHLHLALGATFVKNAAVTACRSWWLMTFADTFIYFLHVSRPLETSNIIKQRCTHALATGTQSLLTIWRLGVLRLIRCSQRWVLKLTRVGPTEP